MPREKVLAGGWLASSRDVLGEPCLLCCCCPRRLRCGAALDRANLPGTRIRSAATAITQQQAPITTSMDAAVRQTNNQSNGAGQSTTILALIRVADGRASSRGATRQTSSARARLAIKVKQSLAISTLCEDSSRITVKEIQLLFRIASGSQQNHLQPCLPTLNTPPNLSLRMKHYERFGHSSSSPTVP